MLDEGTRTRSALQIADRAEQIGASLSTGSSMDMSFIAARSLKRNARAAFELLADVLLEPQFPEPEIERVRNDRLTHLLQHRDNPGAIAAKALYNAIYGADHPYGFTEIGTEASNRAITRDQLERFWTGGYVPRNSGLVVAGAITLRELEELAENLLGSWTGDGYVPRVAEAPRFIGRRIVIVDKPGLPQTSLRVGHVGVSRSDPDYVALDVMNTALGGLFTSRINLNLRETHGFTYGATSSFVFRRGPGPFVVGTNVRTDVTAAAVKEILGEMERIRSGEPTPEELAIVKDSIARSLPGCFETTPQAASTAGQLFVHGLPLDYYRALPALVEQVSAADVRRVAQKHLSTENLVIVAVGDRSQIVPQLTAANIAPIEFRNLDGVASP
jgi:zinc protease